MVSINKLMDRGWISCPECGSEPEDSTVDWTWEFECPDCGESVSGMVR